MGADPHAEVSQSAAGVRPQSSFKGRLIVPDVGLARKGDAERFPDTSPTLSSVHVNKGSHGKTQISM